MLLFNECPDALHGITSACFVRAWVLLAFWGMVGCLGFGHVRFRVSEVCRVAHRRPARTNIFGAASLPRPHKECRLEAAVCPEDGPGFAGEAGEAAASDSSSLSKSMLSQSQSYALLP